MLTINGSYGEGGGQILRSSLALSMITGRPFRVENIRAGRSKPGLMRQHLTAVQAAAQISQAQVEGAMIGSKELTFMPGSIRPGDYTFSIGTAGSATLVLQTILPALLTASGPSTLVLEGGTHNPYAPPFNFLEKAFLPIVNTMGAQVRATLERAGFYPAGGGRFTVHIEPVDKLIPLYLLERGAITRRTVRTIVANLPRTIAEREIKVIQSKFSWPEECYHIEEMKHSAGPGNLIVVELESEYITEVITAFGEYGVLAENVAGSVVKPVRQYLASGAPVGCHLADQILLPFALAGSGSFRTLPLSRHAQTNIDIIKIFLPVNITVEQCESGEWEVRIVHL